MNLGRGQQRDGVFIMFDPIVAKAVAGNLQPIAGGTRRQVPALAATGFAGLDVPFARELALTVKQVQLLFVGIRLPGRDPAHGQGVRLPGLQVQAGVTNVAPAHGRGLRAQAQAEADH
ncbi:hypothetical protein D3C71_1546100 [compost metagenome]